MAVKRKCIIISSKWIQNHKIGEDLINALPPKCCSLKSDVYIKYNVVCQKLGGFIFLKTIRSDIVKHLISEEILFYINCIF